MSHGSTGQVCHETKGIYTPTPDISYQIEIITRDMDPKASLKSQSIVVHEAIMLCHVQGKGD
jgi:hypothetical protein